MSEIEFIFELMNHKKDGNLWLMAIFENSI